MAFVGVVCNLMAAALLQLNLLLPAVAAVDPLHLRASHCLVVCSWAGIHWPADAAS
jgi:hypothetical protein